jgi:hypothetical protein
VGITMTGSLLMSLLVLASPVAPRRAVLVGSNAAIEGRSPLRFAHLDARAIADVLMTSGGFTANEVVVLLDPTPEQVLAALDAARTALAAQRDEGLLVFYFSGHADQRALFPAGKELPLEQLRTRLSDQSAGVRIGIIDACRGGGWTQAKGFSPAAPFEVGVPALSSEGTALLAASSGLEDAHEAESLQGSFFTHYFVAGLRGAADSTGDGQVTLSEAFAYANRLTIRDTASTSRVPQHPSFDLRLRGRQDVVLTTLSTASTQLVLAQTTGPLEVVQLSTGVTIVEAAPGEQVLRLALPPGPYLVRTFRDGRVLSTEVQVKANEATRVEEASLTLVGARTLPSKGGGAVAVRGKHQLSLGVGVAPLDATLNSFSFGVPLSLDYTFFLHRVLGWRVLDATFVFSTQRGLSSQLTRDFAVMPTVFRNVEWAAHTALTWEPTVLDNGASEMRGAISIGAGAIGLIEGTTSDAATAMRSAAPSAVLSAELVWMLAGTEKIGGLGVRLGLTEQLGFTSLGLLHLLTLELAITGTAGASR